LSYSPLFSSSRLSQVNLLRLRIRLVLTRTAAWPTLLSLYNINSGCSLERVPWDCIAIPGTNKNSLSAFHGIA